MCGIFGAMAKKGHKIDIKKMEILGLWNERRGPDSCGYYYSGNIGKGIDSEKLIGDFFVKHAFIRGEAEHEVFMGHTRKSTYGLNTLDNAHPHSVGDYVQTHNGTIHNIWRLCSKYGIDAAKINVDSCGLAHIINAYGFDVLNLYEGAAALAFTWKNDHPLYLYHGASRDKAHQQLPIEERPLFYIDTPEALYYSSIPNSLVYITDGMEPKRLACNKVFKVVEGKLDMEPVYEVARENLNIDSGKLADNWLRTMDWNAETKTWQPIPVPVKVAKAVRENAPRETGLVINLDTLTKFTPTEHELNKGAEIHQENYPEEYYTTSDIYYRFGRYFRGEDTLLTGMYEIDRDGVIIAINNQKTGSITTRTVDTYYFVQGVMLTGKVGYDTFYSKYIGNADSNFALHISQYSRYPVCNFMTEGPSSTMKKFKHIWWSDGKRYDGCLQVKFAKRKYYIKGGLLRLIKGDKNANLLLSPGEPHFKLTKNEPTLPFKDVQSAEDIILNTIVELTYNWCDRVIKQSDIETLPETFLMVVDAILDKVFTQECPWAVEQSLVETERQTAVQIAHLIKSQKTLRESFLDSKYGKLLTLSFIKTVLEGYNSDDLCQMINRYTITPFDGFFGIAEDATLTEPVVIKDDYSIVENDYSCDLVRQNIMEVDDNTEFIEQCPKLIEQLKDLEDIANKLQALERSEAAQDTCQTTYIAIALVKHRLQEVTAKQQFHDLKKDLNILKSC
jgi:hypothetical protein